MQDANIFTVVVSLWIDQHVVSFLNLLQQSLF